MRVFHSYGPVDAEDHFCVPRRNLIEQMVQQLVGNPQKKGHYFTIWAARQTGKTWLMHQAKNEIVYLYGERLPILALDPLDDLADVFGSQTLDLAALLDRYKSYLQRLKEGGLNPWLEQPRRKTDHQLTEAVGHFHLYAWLKEAIGRRCSLSPEFPTGNGKVDLQIKCGPRRGIIEVKSFVDNYQLKKDRSTAAQYAKDLGLDRVTMAVFIPVTDETVLTQLSSDERVKGV